MQVNYLIRVDDYIEWDQSLALLVFTTNVLPPVIYPDMHVTLTENQPFTLLIKHDEGSVTWNCQRNKVNIFLRIHNSDLDQQKGIEAEELRKLEKCGWKEIHCLP